MPAWPLALLPAYLAALAAARSPHAPPPTSTLPSTFPTPPTFPSTFSTTTTTTMNTTIANWTELTAEEILSINDTETDWELAEIASWNDSTTEFPSLDKYRSVNVSVSILESYREELESLLAQVEEQLAATTSTTPNPTTTQNSVESSGEESGEVGRKDYTSEPSPDPLLTPVHTPPPFRDFVTFRPDEEVDVDDESSTLATVLTTAPSSSTTLNYTLSTPDVVNTTSGTEDDTDFVTEEDSLFQPPNVTQASLPKFSVGTRDGEKVAVFKVPRRGGKSRVGTRQRCWKHSQEELVERLKSEGTYNPDYMAWDVPGVIRFLDHATLSAYDPLPAQPEEEESGAVERNLGALERILRELGLSDCNVRAPDTLARLYNITHIQQRHDSASHPNNSKDRLRTKRSAVEEHEMRKYLSSLQRDEPLERSKRRRGPDRTGVIGQVHTVPFGCSKRGSEEEGYLRLCGVCQAIRRLPDNFFPPFINEVLCDEDKACLYFYDYPHGKCAQKQMNFVVLRNVGSERCERWQKFNLNVRVSCECFVDRMSFFAKYV